MAVKVFHFLNANASLLSYGKLQDGGTAPTNATTSTTCGALVAKLSSGCCHLLWGNTTNTIDATLKPTATSGGNKSWAHDTALTGTFAAGNWTINLNFISTVGTAHDGFPSMRMWKYRAAPDYVSTELTSAIHNGSTITDVNATAKGSTITWNAPSITLSNEFLVIALAWNLTGSSGNNSGNLYLRVGSEVNGCKITTTDFNDGLSASGALGTVSVSGVNATVSLEDAILKQRTCVGAGL